MQCATGDVLVVGGGPAGLISAIFSARVGAKVLIVASAPHAPQIDVQRVETVSQATLQFAEQLGLASCFTAARLSSVGTLFREGKPEPWGGHSQLEKDAGWHIDRLKLEHSLRLECKAAGVSIETAQVLSVTEEENRVLSTLSDGRTISSNLMIDATGKAHSCVPNKRENLSPPLLALTGLLDCQFDETNVDQTRFESHDWGWLWCTSDCGGFYGWTALIDATLPSPEQVLNLKNNSRPRSVHQCVATWHLNVLRSQRILPVGDAAGAIDPASGMGLSNVIETASLVAGVVNVSVKESDCFADVVQLYHSRRIALLVSQADQLSHLYDAKTIIDPKASSSSPAMKSVKI